jgi:translation initiation factor IF-2
MSDVTVKQFAEVVGVPPDRLLLQLGEAGLSVNDENATISDDEKIQLLDFLRQSHGNRGARATGGGSKITLKRKTQTELRATVPAGRGPAGRGATRARPEARTVTVEVRKKRTYVKRADLMAEEQQRLDEEAAEQARIKAEAAARERRRRTKTGAGSRGSAYRGCAAG